MRGRDDGAFRTDKDPRGQIECFSAIVRAGASPGRTDHPPRRNAAAVVATTDQAIRAAAPAASGTETREPLPR